MVKKGNFLKKCDFYPHRQRTKWSRSHGSPGLFHQLFKNLLRLLDTYALTTGSRGSSFWVEWTRWNLFVISGLQFCYSKLPPHPISERSRGGLWITVHYVVVFFRKDQRQFGSFSPSLSQLMQGLSFHRLPMALRGPEVYRLNCFHTWIINI